MRNLLILGATPFTVPLIKSAKKLGYNTIACSLYPTDPGLKESDQAELISILDRRGLDQLIAKYQPAGVVTAASDLATLSIGYLNDKFGLNGIREKQVLAVTNKGNFIRLQKELGLPMPESVVVDTQEPPDKNACAQVGYPAIMKPFFSSGSRGVKKIHSHQDLVAWHPHCLEASADQKGYVVQEFLTNYLEVGCEVFVEKGKVIFFETTHKSVNALQVPTGHCVPGLLNPADKQDLIAQVESICNKLGVEYSPINLDIMTQPGHRPILIDMSFRLGGNLLPEIMDKAYQTNPYERVISYATSPSTDFAGISGKTNGFTGSIIFGSLEEQAFTQELKAKLELLLSSFVKEIVFDFQIGQTLPIFSQGNKRFGHALIQTPDLDTYKILHKKTLEAIQSASKPENPSTSAS